MGLDQDWAPEKQMFTVHIFELCNMLTSSSQGGPAAEGVAHWIRRTPEGGARRERIMNGILLRELAPAAGPYFS